MGVRRPAGLDFRRAYICRYGCVEALQRKRGEFERTGVAARLRGHRFERLGIRTA